MLVSGEGTLKENGPPKDLALLCQPVPPKWGGCMAAALPLQVMASSSQLLEMGVNKQMGARLLGRIGRALKI